mmetsp:Transcript_7345/g.20899  ORF Transcript_7345/g.20899 Transcript_7345/m.20899 type:complete len:297 (+) Transcript_7345:238-1128(+)
MHACPRPSTTMRACTSEQSSDQSSCLDADHEFHELRQRKDSAQTDPERNDERDVRTPPFEAVLQHVHERGSCVRCNQGDEPIYRGQGHDHTVGEQVLHSRRRGSEQYTCRGSSNCYGGLHAHQQEERREDEPTANPHEAREQTGRQGNHLVEDDLLGRPQGHPVDEGAAIHSDDQARPQRQAHHRVHEEGRRRGVVHPRPRSRAEERVHDGVSAGPCYPMPLALRAAGVDMEPKRAAEDHDHHRDRRQSDVSRPQSPINALRVAAWLQRRQHRRAGSAAWQGTPGVAARAAGRATY